MQSLWYFRQIDTKKAGFEVLPFNNNNTNQHIHPLCFFHNVHWEMNTYKCHIDTHLVSSVSP